MSTTPDIHVRRAVVPDEASQYRGRWIAFESGHVVADAASESALLKTGKVRAQTMTMRVPSRDRI